MTEKILIRAALLTALLTGVAGSSARSQDKGNKQTIDITSSFKPVLRNAAKIGFNTSPPKMDTTLPRLTYNIPVQNLVPGLAPVSIQALPLDIDSAASWTNSNYLKAGFGNLKTPFVEAGLSLGDSRTRYNVFASHISSNGKIEYQDYARTRLRGDITSSVSDHTAFHASVGYRQDKYFQYGYDKSLFVNFDRSDLLRRYTTLSAEAGIRNSALTEFGLRYHPTFRLDVFSDNRSNSETNAVLDIPLEKSLNENFIVKIGVNADLTRLKPDNAGAISNNLFQTPVSMIFRKTKFRLMAGIIPSWDRGKFNLLPNLTAEFPVAQEKWVLQAGWIGYYNKGTYMRFAGMNPYISVPSDLRNNLMTERYVGFKGTILNTFSFNAKVGSAEFRQAPLFVNDAISGKSFDVVFEERLRALQVRGELGFTRAEEFSLQAGVNWYGFGSQVTEDRAWGMLPFQLDGHLRWQLMDDLWLKSDLYLWEGALFRTKNGGATRVEGAFDLNAGLEFRITKMFRLWAQFNNITNSRYQRWNQYESYGFNMVGGLILDF